MKTLLNAAAICSLALALSGLSGCAGPDCSVCESDTSKEACDVYFDACKQYIADGYTGYEDMSEQDCAEAAEEQCPILNEAEAALE